MDINSEILPINTTPKRIFYEYLILKKPVLEALLSAINKKVVVLNPKVLKVFAEILYYNNYYKDYEEKLKWKMVFDYDTKVQMMNALDINDRQLNTYFSVLRSFRLLNGKQISKPFIFYPETGFELTFKFNFDNEK